MWTIESLHIRLEEFVASRDDVLVYRLGDDDVFTGDSIDRDELFDRAWEIGRELATTLQA